MVIAGSLKGLKRELITEGERKEVLIRIHGIDHDLTVEVHNSLIDPIGESA